MIDVCWDDLPEDVIFKSWQKLMSEDETYRAMKHTKERTGAIQEKAHSEQILGLLNKADKNSNDFEISVHELNDWLESIDDYVTSVQLSDDELIQYVNGTLNENEEEIESDHEAMDVSEQIEDFALPCPVLENTYQQERRSALEYLDHLNNFYQSNIEAKLYLKFLKNELEQQIIESIQ